MNNDDKQNHWFKRRRYGYGWVPSTWQGWLLVIIFLAVVLSGTVLLKDVPRNTFASEVFLYIALVLIAVLLLVVISLKKGPSPKWRWGSKKSDDPNEDM